MPPGVPSRRCHARMVTVPPGEVFRYLASQIDVKFTRP
jgi:hypothetical protein